MIKMWIESSYDHTDKQLRMSINILQNTLKVNFFEGRGRESPSSEEANRKNTRGWEALIRVIHL